MGSVFGCAQHGNPTSVLTTHLRLPVRDEAHARSYRSAGCGTEHSSLYLWAPLWQCAHNHSCQPPTLTPTPPRQKEPNNQMGDGTFSGNKTSFRKENRPQNTTVNKAQGQKSSKVDLGLTQDHTAQPPALHTNVPEPRCSNAHRLL